MLIVCYCRCVCDKGRHRGQHHRGISSLQPARNLCCVWNLGPFGTLSQYSVNNHPPICTKEQNLYLVKAESLCTLCCLSYKPFISVSVIRQGVSPVGHCSGTAWHMASVLLLLLLSFLITKCTGECAFLYLITDLCKVTIKDKSIAVVHCV